MRLDNFMFQVDDRSDCAPVWAFKICKVTGRCVALRPGIRLIRPFSFYGKENHNKILDDVKLHYNNQTNDHGKCGFNSCPQTKSINASVQLLFLHEIVIQVQRYLCTYFIRLNVCLHISTICRHHFDFQYIITDVFILLVYNIYKHFNNVYICIVRNRLSATVDTLYFCFLDEVHKRITPTSLKTF